jgi:hypothetical protein
MCCFSRPVIDVSRTNIFARAAPEGRQYLADAMTLRAAEDLAMILPLPDPDDILFRRLITGPAPNGDIYLEA